MIQAALHDARTLGLRAALGHALGGARQVIGRLLCGGVLTAGHRPRILRRGRRLGRIRPLLPLRWARHGQGPRGGHESGRTRSQTLVRSLQPTPEAAPPRAGPKRNDPRKFRRRSPVGSTQLVPTHPGEDIGEATGKSTRGGRSVGGLAWATLIPHQPRLRCSWGQHCSVRGQTAAKKRSGKNPWQAPVSLFRLTRAPNLPRARHGTTLGTPASVGRFRLTHSPALLRARHDSTTSHRSVRQFTRMPLRAWRVTHR